MHEVLVNRLGGLSLPRKSVVRLTDRPDMTLDVYRGRKTTIQPNNNLYGAQRNELFAAISQYCQVSMDTLLYGNNTLSNEINSDLFASVHKYIHDTKRI